MYAENGLYASIKSPKRIFVLLESKLIRRKASYVAVTCDRGLGSQELLSLMIPVDTGYADLGRGYQRLHACQAPIKSLKSLHRPNNLPRHFRSRAIRISHLAKHNDICLKLVCAHINYCLLYAMKRHLNTHSAWPSGLRRPVSLRCGRLLAGIPLDTYFHLNCSFPSRSSQLGRSPYKWNQAWYSSSLSIIE